MHSQDRGGTKNSGWELNEEGAFTGAGAWRYYNNTGRGSPWLGADGSLRLVERRYARLDWVVGKRGTNACSPASIITGWDG